MVVSFCNDTNSPTWLEPTRSSSSNTAVAHRKMEDPNKLFFLLKGGMQSQTNAYGYQLYDASDPLYAATELWSRIPPIGYSSPSDAPAGRAPPPSGASHTNQSRPLKSSKVVVMPEEKVEKERPKTALQLRLEKQRKRLEGGNGARE